MHDVVPSVIVQHVETVGDLFALRSAMTAAPDVRVQTLRRFDERLDAHFDGLVVAGDSSWPFIQHSLEQVTAATIFTATLKALVDKRQRTLEHIFSLVETSPETRAGLVAAFGWLASEHLQGVVVRLLASDNPLWCMTGIAACAMHRVNPGSSLAGAIAHASPVARARGLKAVAELGELGLDSSCLAAVQDQDPDCAFWAAWSAVLLGDHSHALTALTQTGTAKGPHRARAFRLALQAMRLDRAHAVLQQFADSPEHRWLIEGSGIAGDGVYLPWLIGQMAKPGTARLAGEAFSLITGADLEKLQMDQPRPANFDVGPSDNPDDTDVEMDPDERLPWPDVAKIEKWWASNEARFQKGTRYFMGAPVTREHCIDVLKNGYQRQRILAAHYLCLLDPGTPLFNTSAPAWRQQRLLAKLT